MTRQRQGRSAAGRWWQRPASQRLLIIVLGASVLWRLATVKAVTRQGIDFQVSTLEIPLYVKAVDFLDRHYHYQWLAREITRAGQSQQERVLAIFDWTRRHIRHTPGDAPVVDDHIWHIIIRGHGLDDQIADVFATLSTYAGVPAFWNTFSAPRMRRGLVLSFTKVDGRWRVFDVSRGLIFRTAGGELATPEDLTHHPELVTAAAGETRIGDIPYPEFFGGLTLFQAPRTLRADLQKPWPRVWYEARRRLGAERTS